MIKDLQHVEKIRILRQKLKGSKLEKLNKTVAMFTPEGLAETQKSAAEMVKELDKVLNAH